MCQAAYEDDIRRVAQLMNADPRNLNVQDDLFGDTPIIAACKQGNVKTVEYLLDQNADVEIRNKVCRKRPETHCAFETCEMCELFHQLSGRSLE